MLYLILLITSISIIVMTTKKEPFTIKVFIPIISFMIGMLIGFILINVFV